MQGKSAVVLFFASLFILPCALSSTVNSESNDHSSITEAPTGFDTETNGVVDQATMDRAREDFEEIEVLEDGLGPVFNANSCAIYHANPVSGGDSQITETRVGRFDGVTFIENPGGYPHSRASH